MTRPTSSSLVGRRVKLRPLHVRDFDAWREARVANSAWLKPWEPRPDPAMADPTAGVGAFRSRCAAWDRQREFDSAYGFGLFLVETGEFVGEVSLGTVHRGPFQSASIGYWIDSRRAGNGYAPEGVALILAYGFDDLRLHRMEAAIVPRNGASIRVVEKLGLRKEGISVGYLEIAGTFEDHVHYAITAEEWVVRRGDFEAVVRGVTEAI